MTAAIYARKSTDQNGVADEAKSVTRQVDHARAYAKGKGWTVDETHIYVDDGISGAEFAKRPDFLRLMNALKPAPPFNILIMSEESRLGRESIETAYALKQLVQAGVRVFFYLEDRERTLDSPTDKVMLSLTTFADEMERERARQRTHDALIRKVRSGYVAGGLCFGYRNIEVLGGDGKRSHVVRQIEDSEADVVRRIFHLCADGYGLKAIAKGLNGEGAISPRAQQGRSRSWAPSSVREVLYRPLYRGEVVWNQTRKRDRWGQSRRGVRQESEWVRVPAPDLRIVDDTAWAAAHTRLDAARAVYFKGTNGRRFGRPAIGNPSKYLLTNLAQCGVCGSSLKVRTRSHRHFRAKFYGCSGYHDRGRTVCPNGADVPMEDADNIVLEAVLDDVLTQDVLEDAVNEAISTVQGEDDTGSASARVDKEIARLEGEQTRLANAIAAGGNLDGLVLAMKDRETHLWQLRQERHALDRSHSAPLPEPNRLRRDLQDLAEEWRDVLIKEPAHARAILIKLLVGRVTFTPGDQPKRWKLSGQGTVSGLFSAECFPLGMASPTGFEPVS